jgi:hypothetical protein
MYLRLIALFCIELVVFLPVAFSVDFPVGSSRPGEDDNSTTQTSAVKHFLNVTIPRYHNERDLTISGTTKPLSYVEVYIDEKRARAMYAPEDGAFTIYAVSIPGEEVEIEIKSTADNVELSRKFNITLDFSPPDLKISEIPEFTSQQTLVINGTINEYAAVEFSVTSQKDIVKPAKVKGLSIGEVGTNTIEINWDKNSEEDVVEYVVYRDDIRLTTTQDSEFIDSALDSGRSYSYQVAALDDSCNEGEKSEPLTVSTEEGGSVYNITPEEIKLSCNQYSYFQTRNVNGRFTEGLVLGEGVNNVKITATDRAGNSVVVEKTVVFDMSPPEILETNLDKISPSYIREVTLKGRVSEPATIYVYLGDDDSPSYTDVTDDNNEFSTEIRLRRDVKHGFKREDERRTSRVETGDAWDNEIRIVAVDKVGLSTEVRGDVIYALCGYGSWWHVDIKEPTPEMLTPRLLIEGFGEIGIAFNISWQGGFEEATITDVEVRVQELSLEKRGEYDLGWAQRPMVHRSNDRKRGYIQLKINPQDYFTKNMTLLEKENNLSDHRKGGCIVPSFGCVKIPLQLVIDFEEELPEQYEADYLDRTRESVRVNHYTQKQCWDIEIPIDRRIPSDKLPEDFLRAAVDLLDSTIENIKMILDPLRTVEKVLFYSCMGAWVIDFFMIFNEKWTCGFSGGIIGKLLTKGSFDVDIARTGKCEIAYDDEEEQEACQACSDAIKQRKDFEETFLQQTCDRIFCPSAPTFQKYVRDAQKDKTPFKVISVGEGKALKIDTRSDCAREVKTVYEAGTKYDMKNLFISSSEEEGETDCSELHSSDPDCCVNEYKRKWGSSCLIMDEFKESVCLAAQEQNKLADMEENVGVGCNRIWNAIAGFCDPDGMPVPDLVNTNLYYRTTKSPYDYEVILNDGRTIKGRITHRDDNGFIVTQDNGEEIFVLNKDVKEQKVVEDKKQKSTGKVVGVESITGKAEVVEILEGDKAIREARRKAFMSVDNTRGDDKCLGGHRFGPHDDTQIYYRILAPTAEDKEYHIHRGYITRRVGLATLSVENQGIIGYSFPDKDRLGDSIVNEELIFRPVSNDLAGLFQDPKLDNLENNLNFNSFKDDLVKCADKPRTAEKKAEDIYKEILSKIGVSGKEYIVDPTAGLLRSVQCVCLPAIVSYLNLYKRMMEAIRNCFNTILVTGDGSAGVCQAVLSVYVCDLIWDAIRCFTRKYSTGGFQRSAEGSLGNFFGALTSAGPSINEKVQSRYGASAMWKSMFAEKKLVHSVCLFAFTGTWDLDVAGLLEQDYPIVINSQGFLYPCERRFISFNPISRPYTGLTNWNYHFGAGLVAGADLEYTIEMVCSDGVTCNPSDGFVNGRCDCPGGEQRYMIKSGRLKAGEILDEEIFEPVQGGPRALGRFDKAVLTWRYKNNRDETVSETKECTIKQAGGRPPAYCNFDYGSGAFRCGVDFGAENWIRFYKEPEPDKDEYWIGDKISFEVEVQQSIPEDTTCNHENCEYTKYLQWVIYNKNGKKIADNFQALEPFNRKGRYSETINTEHRISGSDFGKSIKLTFNTLRDDGFVDDFTSTSVNTIEVSKKGGSFTYSVGSVEDGKFRGTKHKLCEVPFDRDTGKVQCGTFTIKIKDAARDGLALLQAMEEGTEYYESECAEGEDWKAKFTFYNAREGGGGPSRTKAVYNGRIKGETERVIEFKVRCVEETESRKEVKSEGKEE